MPSPVQPPEYAPVHPGEILSEEFLAPLGLTPYAVARRINVPRTRIERLARGETAVTVDTALRLSRFLGTTPQFWLNLQSRFDLLSATVDASDLDAIVPVSTAA
jgi:addiction module HigA family antidote